MKTTARHSRRAAQALVSAIALAGFAICALAQELPPVRVKVLGSWDSLVQYKDFELPFWQKRVPELTGGAVTADVAAFNTLGLKGTEIVQLMKIGMIDFGTSVLAYGADADVVPEGVDLPGLSASVGQARTVADAYLPVLDQFFQSRHRIKVLALWPYPAQITYCKEPLTGLADLAGRKIRVGTRTIAEFVAALGGLPVSIPFEDVYGRLGDGTVDCAVTGALPGNVAKLYEVTQHLYPLPLSWSMTMQAVNLDAWNRLDPRVQTVLAAGVKTLSDAIWGRADLETVEGIRCNTGDVECSFGTRATMVLHPVSDADRVRLDRLLREVIVKHWAQRCGAECVDKWNRTVGKVVNIESEP